MSGARRQHRPGSARSRAGSEPVQPPAPPAAEFELPAIEPGAVVLEERTAALGPGGRVVPLGRSMSGALVGTLLVVGLAFGAALGPGGALGPGSGGSDATKAPEATQGSVDKPRSNEDGKDGTASWTHEPKATDKPDATDGDHPDATEKPHATDTPKDEPTDKPDATPKPTEKPDATKPPTEYLAIAVAIKEGHPVIEWGSCDDLDFDYYKVVRSKDSTVTWPPSDGDEGIGVVEPGGTRRAYDKYAPHGVKVWYRVFCVRKGEDGYKVVKASATKGIEVPEEPTPPDPIKLGLEAGLTDGGKVALHWTACEVDGFAFYKVLRSTTTESPSYLPWHDGTEVVGAIGEMWTTSAHVAAPDPGQTAWYRVQCFGYSGDQKVLLGQSAAVAVTVP